ncbi:hypothetical protein BDW59DRAFT_160763 [Aspergillus cavernicola]|uniref:Uncharacterized protein n=1 Tax=Aspergillus cavernicola TaxID=176166 RepID=A0ABR4IGI7_9EURO
MKTPTLSTLFISLLTLTGTTTLASPDDTAKHLTKRVSCIDLGYRPVAEAQSCVDFLFNRGTENCVVSGTNQEFCSNGNTAIMGSNINNRPGGGDFFVICYFILFHFPKVWGADNNNSH